MRPSAAPAAYGGPRPRSIRGRGATIRAGEALGRPRGYRGRSSVAWEKRSRPAAGARRDAGPSGRAPAASVLGHRGNTRSGSRARIGSRTRSSLAAELVGTFPACSRTPREPRLGPLDRLPWSSSGRRMKSAWIQAFLRCFAAHSRRPDGTSCGNSVRNICIRSGDAPRSSWKDRHFSARTRRTLTAAWTAVDELDVLHAPSTPAPHSFAPTSQHSSDPHHLTCSAHRRPSPHATSPMKMMMKEKEKDLFEGRPENPERTEARVRHRDALRHHSLRPNPRSSPSRLFGVLEP